MHTREEKLQAFGRLLDVQDRLRKDCPWDRKQTFESLRPYSIEEVFELAEALACGNLEEVKKELGDLMEHVVFYSMLGEEEGRFDVADVCDTQSDKLMFRHDFIDWGPDTTMAGCPAWTVSSSELVINDRGQVVYAEEQNANTPNPITATQVESTWEQRKQRERHGNKSVLSGVPASLPSLIKAYRIQDKARNVGFDWQKKEDVWLKVREELDEFEAELRKGDQERSAKELGDFLFSIINAARLYHLNPDNALESTNQKFIRRFGYVERKTKEMGREMKDMTLAELDALWDEAKAKENK